MWTTTPPTKPGSYGWRNLPNWTASIIEVYDCNGTLCGSQNYAPVAQIRGEWWDAPIVMPWEQQPEPVNAELLADLELERIREAIQDLIAVAQNLMKSGDATHADAARTATASMFRNRLLAALETMKPTEKP